MFGLFGGLGGSKFFLISMIFDKILMILMRYGKLIIFMTISFLLSSYLYFIIEFNFKTIIQYNLLNRPEVVIKYFWFFLKNYYHNRTQLSILVTGKLLIIIIAPYLFIKIIRIISNFFLFLLAAKIARSAPMISQFILNKILSANYTPQSKPKIVKKTISKPSINLRK